MADRGKGSTRYLLRDRRGGKQLANDVETGLLPRPQPTRAVKVAAARARVSADKKRGVTTPDWIKELAGSADPPPPR